MWQRENMQKTLEDKRVFLLDDVRNYPEVTSLCRTATCGIKALEMNPYYDIYYFDHDLGSLQEKSTGYDVLMYALHNRLLNPVGKVGLVTNNPVGKQKMVWLLEFYGYTFSLKTGFWSKESDVD